MWKILIVDDDVHARLLYRDLLTEGGYQVFNASDGLAALRRIREDKPNLVIMDIKIPGINGIEVLERLQKNHGSPPIIICTTARHLKEDLGLKVSNVKAFLTKPIDIDTLKLKVNEILQ